LRPFVVEAHPRFAITRLRPGEYAFEFAWPGVGSRLSDRWQLTSGQTIDIGTVDLAPTAAVSGTVIDGNEQPLRSVRVRILRPGGGVAASVLERMTDANGAFEFPRVVPADYDVELFSEAMGWQSLSSDQLHLLDGQRVSRAIQFTGTQCALTIDIEPPADRSTTYVLTLPVSDRRIQLPLPLATGADTVTTTYRSVPCTGLAAVESVTGEAAAVYSAPLKPGDVHLLVPSTDHAVRDVRFLIEGKPLDGATLWAIPRESSETVSRVRRENVTDPAGRARLFMSQIDDVVLYAHRDQNTLVVGRPRFDRTGGALVVDLPSRHLYGVVRNHDGVAQAGLQYLASLVTGPGESLPTSAVTSFKGVTDAEGRIQVPGLGEGKWNITVIYDRSIPPKQVGKQFELKASHRGLTRIDVETPSR
jgi:hypothetical protein